MLLPSALPCDIRRPSTRSRLTPSRLFTTPPPSDDYFPSSNGLVGTCRALQSLLNGSPAPSPRRSKTPRLQSPLQIQPRTSARSRKSKQNESSSSISSPKPQRPRGPNKRRRDSYEADFDAEDANFADAQTPPRNTRFSTPKRRRYVPYDLPLGLSQSDFYSLRSPPITQSPPSPAQRRKQELELEPENRASSSSFDPDAALPSIEETAEPNAPDTESWTSDDDQRLVELVLEKFQLSKRDWDDCARRMGKDNASIGRRWQALLGEGDVGLRRGRRMVRGRLDENWM